MPEDETKPEVKPSRIRLASMLGHTLPVGLVAAAAGAYPTWQWAGVEGLWAELSAGVIVLVAMLGSAVVVVRAAAGGPARAALAFTAAGLARAIVCIGLAGGAWAVLHLPLAALGIWLVAFYLVMLAGEVVWLARALRKA
jgi:hypothetical protein